MARYIDAEALTAEFKRLTLGENSLIERIFADGVYAVIDTFPTADVVPKSEEGAECPTCHGTGRIGTTDWLTKNISNKQLAEEKAQAIAEHEQYIKTEYAREIFEEIERFLYLHFRFCKEEIGNDDTEYVKGRLELNTQIQNFIAELKKKYAEH